MMRLAPLLLLSFFLVSCASKDRAGYSVKLLKFREALPEETTMKISLWDQKAWLLNAEGEAILEADISTGVPGHETPEGVFPVVERMEEKRSNRYGKYVEIESRKVVVEKSWEHEGQPPEGTEYEGISMPHWMRLTWDGVGMHEGEFKKRRRASFGCIRVYPKAQAKIFGKTQLGTEVEIVPQSLMAQYAW
ncbi:MAG: L,D-transpeptidase family protein [Akkermansiaceae bacterium]